jgi:hypothetical protein
MAFVCAIFTGSLVAQQGYVVISARDQPPGRPGVRDLTPEEKAAFDRMLEATAGYVKSHPEYAPQLEAMREAKDRLRRWSSTKHKFGFRTLPDIVDLLTGRQYWFPPGARGPSGGPILPRRWPAGGQILPPNTVLVNDGELDRNDPAGGCLGRARGIRVIIHEGFRQLNVGVVDAETGPDCDLLAYAVKCYFADIQLYQDFIVNGVPTVTAEGTTLCNLSPAEVDVMQAAEMYAEKLKAKVCDDMRQKNCMPMPEECS